MSERITAANLDEVIKRNEVIEEQMKQSASLIWSKYNPMQINSPIQLALQILRPYGLIQLPIDNHYLSGAIFVRDGKRIPLINTALPRANQYFTAWHEIYHLLFDEVSFDHLIESEILMEERKAEYFAALMLLGNLMPYFEGLKDMEFQAKAFQCMNAFQAPYKAVLISLYESAVKNGNTAIAEEVKENFDVQVEDIAQRFRDLGLDDSLVRPSYVVNVSPLQEKINKTIRNEPEVEYHKDNKRKSRKMSCKPFATLVYQKMGWDSECRYKMLGYRITFEGETLYVFDLLVPEIFHEGQRKKNAVDSQDNAASTKPVNSRKGFYLDDIVGTFGVPVEEHRKESEVKQMDGYVSMGILTGKIAPEAGKD